MARTDQPAAEAGVAGHGGTTDEPPTSDLTWAAGPVAPALPEPRPVTPPDHDTPRLPGGEGGPVAQEPDADAPMSGAPVPHVPGPAGAEPDAGLPAAPGAGEPPASPPRHRGRHSGSSPRWARALVAVGALLILLSAGTVSVINVLARRYENSVTHDELLSPDSREDTDSGLGRSVRGPLNYLLIGSDFKPRAPQDGQRSDTIIILHIPATLDRAYLVSIPRDLRVEIPPYPAAGFRGDETKINAAFQHGGGGRGGAQLVAETLTRLVGIRFNGAAIINFEGFKRAVDVLGGVFLCVDRRVASNHMGYDKNGNLLELYADEEGRIQGLPEGGQPVTYEEGCRRMSGVLALDYSRIRYGLPRGDYDRQAHQQQFLRAVLAEGLSQGIATNPVKFDQFLRAVGSALTVDTGDDRLADLIFGLRHVTPRTLVGVAVPSYPEMIGGVSYILPEALAGSLYKAVREDHLDAWTVENPSWVNHL